MSIQTELLKLFGYEARDGESTFNLDLALNENWKKIDDYLKGVLLSDLSNADDATLQAVKAIVLSMVANNLTTTAANLLLDARQGKVLGDALNAHLANKNNPHGVTLAQLGAADSVLAQLGDGYGTCSTAAATKAKVVTLANFVRRTGSRVSVYFTYTVPASATMNVNSTGAVAMRYKGAAITAGLIPAGAVADFVFDGTYWQLVGTTNAPMNIVTGSYTGADGTSRTFTFGFKPKLLLIYGTNTGGGVSSVIPCDVSRAATSLGGQAKAPTSYMIDVSVSSTGVTLGGQYRLGYLDYSIYLYNYVAIG